MSVNATFAVAARTRKVSRRPSTCPTKGNILILHKTLVVRQSKYRLYNWQLLDVQALTKHSQYRLYYCFTDISCFLWNKLTVVLFHFALFVNFSAFNPRVIFCACLSTRSSFVIIICLNPSSLLYIYISLCLTSFSECGLCFSGPFLPACTTSIFCS